MNIIYFCKKKVFECDGEDLFQL